MLEYVQVPWQFHIHPRIVQVASCPDIAKETAADEHSREGTEAGPLTVEQLEVSLLPRTRLLSTLAFRIYGKQ